MRMLILSSLLLSLPAFAQMEMFGQDVDGEASMDFTANSAGPGARMKVGLTAEQLAVTGSMGNINDTFIGSVDVTLQDELAFGGSRKFRMIAGWTLFNLDASALSRTIDGALKIKLGLAYDKSKISYNLSPISSFKARDNHDHIASISHGVDIEQKIGQHLKILGTARYAELYGNKGKNKKGESFKGRGEAGYKLKNGITVLAFYELEKYAYKSVDNSTLNTVEHKKNLAVVGVGIRGVIGGTQKSKSH